METKGDNETTKKETVRKTTKNKGNGKDPGAPGWGGVRGAKRKKGLAKIDFVS